MREGTRRLACRTLVPLAFVALTGLAASCGEQTQSGGRNEKPAQKVENAQVPATTATTKPAGKEKPEQTTEAKKPEQTAEAKKPEEPGTEKAAAEQHAAEQTTEQAAQEQYAANQYAADRRAVADRKQAADRKASAEKAAAEQYAAEQTTEQAAQEQYAANQYAVDRKAVADRKQAADQKASAEEAVAEQYATGQKAVGERATTDPASPSSQATTAPSSTTLSLTVPKLGIHGVPVVDDVSEAGLSQGAGHLPGTGFPWQGEGSNTYIAGHRLGYPGTPSDHVFYDLPNLALGDSISLTDENGTTYDYAVSEVQEVSPTDLWVSSPVAGRDMVTLQTCIEDFGDEWTPGPDWLARYIVRADRV